jgi:outer membrane protein
MTSKFLRLSLAAAVMITISALAQTTPDAPSSAAAATKPAASAPAPVATGGGTKVGTININEAIIGSNEGRRDMETLSKKFEPKQTELKGQNDELESLKKQLSTQGDKLNEDAAANLKRQIETKQKSFDRAYQDFQDEAGNQQQEIAGKVLQKMAPLIVKYAQENGFGVIVDTSKVWPQSPVLWWAETVDITKAIVDGYNVQSGVPAPAPAGAAKPSTTKPATGAGAAKPPAQKPAEPPK